MVMDHDDLVEIMIIALQHNTSWPLFLLPRRWCEERHNVSNQSNVVFATRLHVPTKITRSSYSPILRNLTKVYNVVVVLMTMRMSMTSIWFVVLYIITVPIYTWTIPKRWHLPFYGWRIHPYCSHRWILVVRHWIRPVSISIHRYHRTIASMMCALDRIDRHDVTNRGTRRSEIGGALSWQNRATTILLNNIRNTTIRCTPMPMAAKVLEY